ncbi:MAG: hypothetical protein Fur0039_10380 [Rhodocyclaceae bacterium]
MRLSREDLLRLRVSVLLAISLIVCGASLVLLTGRWHQEEEDLARRALLAREQARSKLVRARSGQDEVRRSIERFRALARAGVVGEERRIEWIERIKAIEVSRGLSPVRFEIAPRRPLEAALAPGADAGFEFLASAMRLEMRVLHEGDLLGLLQDLHATPGAFVRPRECSIERLAWAAEGTGLKTLCTIDWITLREKRP